MFKRIKGKARWGNGGQRPGKPGGHSDHWGCLFRQVEQQTLLDLILSTAERDPEPDRSRSGVTACRTRGDALCICVLAEGRTVSSAYPEVVLGPTWPVALTEIIRWSNGLEGQLSGTCHGAAVSFFDTRFYANSTSYRAGQTYDFVVGGFAYRIGPAEDVEAESELGVKVSFKGARAYLPAGLSTEGADIDDYWFHSPLEGPTRAVSLAGKPLTVYPVTLAIPDEFDMSINLIASEHVLEPGSESAGPEDDLQGFLWLQGHLAHGGER